MKKVISGIQQLGVGVSDLEASFRWYRDYFGFDIKIFEDEGVAALMLPYTGGVPQQRKAVLALNLNGGGGLEIWQYKIRKPQYPAFDVRAGDLGLYAGKIKVRGVKVCSDAFKAKPLQLLSSLQKDPSGHDTFFLQDPNGNIFQIVPSEHWFSDQAALTGGVYGAVVGVSDMEKSIRFYSRILGYDQVVYDQEGVFDDLKSLPGGRDSFRRVLLRHSQPRKGAFSRILGASEMELIQVRGRHPQRIFENRFWGDPGFIHLCFDVKGLDAIKSDAEADGFPFTVDTGSSFDMGDAAGRFAYVEDPDGTLIELVETYKVPVLKKLGLYLNLRKRDPEKPFPDWLIKMFRFNRVKG